MRTPCCPTREALQKIIDERAVADSDPGASLDLMRDYAERALEFPCPCQRLATLERVVEAARRAYADHFADRIHTRCVECSKYLGEALDLLDQEPR